MAYLSHKINRRVGRDASLFTIAVMFFVCIMSNNVFAAYVAPSRPLAEQIRWKDIDVYEYQTVTYGGVPRGTIKGDYLGVGLCITLDTPEPDYDGFVAEVSKTKSTPVSLGEGYVQNSASVGESYYTGKLEPETTYYVYVATYNVKTGYSAFTNLYSEWSDPIVVKTAAEKKTQTTNGKNDDTSDISAGKANPMTVKGRTVAIRYKKLKQKTQTVSRKKAIKISKAKGKVTYKLLSVTKKKFKKYFKVNAKTGKITVKKGLKKGSYKLKVQVTAAGNSSFKKISKTAKVTINIK